MNYKIIFSPTVARKLLKMGHVIVDIKPNKNNKEMTVFIFEDNEQFRYNLSIIKG